MDQAENLTREAMPAGDGALGKTAEANFSTKFELRGKFFTLYGRVHKDDVTVVSNQPTVQPNVELNIVPTDMARNMFNSGSPGELATVRDELQTVLSRSEQLVGTDPMFWV